MTAQIGKDPSYTVDFADVRRAELEWIRRRRDAVGDIAHDAPVVGLALSGGGIRSATFNLGVLQALGRKRLLSRIDYLSSVSGGGYIASCLTWVRSRGHAADDFSRIPLASGDGTVLDWLRAHGKYLIAGRGLSGWSLGASVLAGALLNLFVLLPLLLLAIGAASMDWFAMRWPSWLHLPAAKHVPAHDGFMLMALAGISMLALYLVATLAFALSTALPPLRRISAEHYFRRRLGQLLAGGVSALAIGALPVLTGIEETVAAFLREDAAREATRNISWLLPMVTGAVSLWRANDRNGNTQALATIGLALLLYGGFTGLYHLANHTALLSTTGFAAWLGASLLLSMLCDVNAVSMHSYYRSRLSEAFLPEVQPATRGSAPILFRLTDVSPDSGAAFHIVNTTLNTTSSKNPTLRARNGESMVLTPLFCGAHSTGYRRTAQYLGGQMTLSAAFSVSGAAVDPDMYATRSRPISFVMALLNARLGYWTANPRSVPRRWQWPSWYRYMLREMLGIGLAETEANIHLADGGHFENLGVYELLRRRCRYIIVSDAGADPRTTLADLGQAMQRARADFGAEIDVCADAFSGGGDGAPPRRAYLFGTVTYADGSTGEILYLKALLHEHLTADVYSYWRLNPAFPNQSTSNQFYGEMQFDSYRELGLQLMSGILGNASAIEEVFDSNRRMEQQAAALLEQVA